MSLPPCVQRFKAVCPFLAQTKNSQLRSFASTPSPLSPAFSRLTAQAVGCPVMGPALEKVRLSFFLFAAAEQEAHGRCRISRSEGGRGREWIGRGSFRRHFIGCSPMTPPGRLPPPSLPSSFSLSPPCSRLLCCPALSSSRVKRNFLADSCLLASCIFTPALGVWRTPALWLVPQLLVWLPCVERVRPPAPAGQAVGPVVDRHRRADPPSAFFFASSRPSKANPLSSELGPAATPTSALLPRPTSLFFDSGSDRYSL